MWEETVFSLGNPPVWLGDHMYISDADTGNETRVAVFSGKRFTTAAVGQILSSKMHHSHLVSQL